MKKILFYINSLEHGGAEHVMLNLATDLRKRNYEVLFLTSHIASHEYPVPCEIKREYLTDKRISNFVLRNRVYILRLRKILKREKPDLLISFMPEPNFRSLIAGAGLGNHILISVRNDPDKEYPGLLHKILAKILYRMADGVVFQTEEAKKWFPKAIQKKGTIICNHIDDKFYKNPYDGERKDIVSVGRLTRQKNHKMLIEAFSQIKDKTNDNLYIYGEGNCRRELEKIIAEKKLEQRVFLPGMVKDVAKKIEFAKVFVLSSDYEGMPNALMEAMALGIPCIATDCPCQGVRYLLEQDAGVLIPIGDTKALAAVVLKMCCKENLRKRYGSNARKRAELFKPEIIFNQWEEYISSLL